MITRYDNTTKVADVSVSGDSLKPEIQNAVDEAKTYAGSALALIDENSWDGGGSAPVTSINCNLAGSLTDRDFFYIQFAAETIGTGNGYIGLRPIHGSDNNCHWYGVDVTSAGIGLLNIDSNPKFCDIAVDGTNQGISGWVKVTGAGGADSTPWWNYTYMIERADYGVRMGGGRLNFSPRDSGPLSVELESNGPKMAYAWIKVFALKQQNPDIYG